MCSKWNRRFKYTFFNIITGINESKILTKVILCECKLKFDKKSAIQVKSEIMINADAKVKSIIYVKKIIFGILLHVVVKMVNI